MRQALPLIMQIAKAVGFSLKGTIVSLDGAYDCRKNRKGSVAKFTIGTQAGMLAGIFLMMKQRC